MCARQKNWWKIFNQIFHLLTSNIGPASLGKFSANLYVCSLSMEILAFCASWPYVPYTIYTVCKVFAKVEEQTRGIFIRNLQMSWQYIWIFENGGKQVEKRNVFLRQVWRFTCSTYSAFKGFGQKEKKWMCGRTKKMLNLMVKWVGTLTTL